MTQNKTWTLQYCPSHMHICNMHLLYLILQETEWIMLNRVFYQRFVQIVTFWYSSYSWTNNSPLVPEHPLQNSARLGADHVLRYAPWHALQQVHAGGRRQGGVRLVQVTHGRARCMYDCVRLFECVHVWLCVWVCFCVWVWLWGCVCTFDCMMVYFCLCVCVCGYVCMRKCVRGSVCAWMCVVVWMCACMTVCVCVCVCLCVWDRMWGCVCRLTAYDGLFVFVWVCVLCVHSQMCVW